MLAIGFRGSVNLILARRKDGGNVTRKPFRRSTPWPGPLSPYAASRAGKVEPQLDDGKDDGVS